MKSVLFAPEALRLRELIAEAATSSNAAEMSFLHPVDEAVRRKKKAIECREALGNFISQLQDPAQ